MTAETPAKISCGFLATLSHPPTPPFFLFFLSVIHVWLTQIMWIISKATQGNSILLSKTADGSAETDEPQATFSFVVKEILGHIYLPDLNPHVLKVSSVYKISLSRLKK